MLLPAKELLATLSAVKIEELYDPACRDEANLSRIAAGLQFVVDDLSNVVQHLRTSRLV